MEREENIMDKDKKLENLMDEIKYFCEDCNYNCKDNCWYYKNDGCSFKKITGKYPYEWFKKN